MAKSSPSCRSARIAISSPQKGCGRSRQMVERLRAELCAGRASGRSRGSQTYSARPALLDRAAAHRGAGASRDAGRQGEIRVNGRPCAAGWRRARVPDRGRGRSGSCAREDFLCIADRATAHRRRSRRSGRTAGRRRGDPRSPLAIIRPRVATESARAAAPRSQRPRSLPARRIWRLRGARDPRMLAPR